MALFGGVARLADELAGEGGRLKKRAAIAEAIGLVAGDRTDGELRDAGLFAMYLAGTPFAEADGRKLNAGGALLSKAVKEVSGAGDAELGAAYRRHGDLGAAAFDLLVVRAGGKLPEVLLADVQTAFAGMAVAATTKVRAGLVEGLLRRATAVEAKYLLKLMLGDMRIGVKQSLVEEAIAAAAAAEVVAVRHAVMLEADLAGAVERAFRGTLGEARMRLFHPLGFMLASPVETPEEAVERFTAKPAKAMAAAKTPKKRRSKKAAAEAEDAAEEFADAPDTELIAAPEQEEAERLAVEPGFGDSGAASRDEGNAMPEAAGEAPAAGGKVEAYLEDKYDGMRAQLHCGDPNTPGRVVLYSRNRDDVTESFPELVEAFARVGTERGGESADGALSVAPGEADLAALGTGGTSAGAVILDGEILGWDFAEGKALAFALLGQRIGRKRVGNAVRREIPVVFMAFDVLYAGNGLTLDLPLRARRERLESLVRAMEPVARSPIEVPETPKAAKPRRAKAAHTAGQAGLFAPGFPEAAVAGERSEAATPPSAETVQRLMISPASLVETAAAIDQAYRDARARANEGVMLKAAGSLYLPGRRGLSWVKLKRELATLDVVITGAEYGSGRRSQLLSDYTFAVRGPGGHLLNVGKAYSGVTDAEIVDLTAWLRAHTLEDFGHFRTVEPLVILEVAFNNIMRSDRHASGFALRFPRIVRIRTDKPVEEIDTVERVEEVFRTQPDRPAE